MAGHQESREALAALHERAEDLHETLRSTSVQPGAEKLASWEPALSHFQRLAQQLQLLRALSDDTLLSHMVVQPVSITDDPNAIPLLMSTRLDVEHEDQRAEEAARVGVVPRDVPAAHNVRVAEAVEHFAGAAAAMGLLSAGTLAQDADPT